MFDSQNTRGKQLEAYNLLKAYHIRAMADEPEEDKIRRDQQWENATRFAKISLHASKPQDVLKKIFNESLYRSRIWARKEEAYRFSKEKIDEFKGITISNKETVDHPFQNTSVLQVAAMQAVNAHNLTFNGLKHRFNTKILSNVNPFTLIDQPILNGKAFFDYVETYVEIYKQLFILSGDNFLSDFKQFFKAQCEYDNSYRIGDQYLKEVYKSLIIFMFDKYGEDGVNNYYQSLYTVVYRLRLEKYQVRYNAVAKYPVTKKLFAIISRSKNYFDLRHIQKEAMRDIDCYKEESVIIEELLRQGVTIIRKNNDIDGTRYEQYKGWKQ